MKRLFGVLAVAAAGALLAAPVAHAAPDNDPFGPKDVTADFVNAFDLAAYAPGAPYSLIVSPFGTSQPILCSAFHARTGCTQTDPAGVTHTLTVVNIPTGPSINEYRPLYFYNPF